MRRNLAFLFLWLLACNTSLAQTLTELERMLFDLPDVRFERVESNANLDTYLLHVKQPVDHTAPEKGHFYQQVFLLHRGFDAPMVMNTDGYNLTRRPSELVGFLDSNYISVEHRFFGPSTPDGQPWENLTIQQAAADYHHIREILGEIYQSDWVSTGISKGGETCTYYKWFYPDDVSVSVPYVAPFPDELKDPRIYDFLATKGSQELRDRIFAFQKAVLENKAELVPLFEYYLKGRGSKVEYIGGPEAALELFVLEYPFSFWQSGKSPDSVPDATDDPKKLLDHLLDGGDYWYLLDDQTEGMAAHYYQHATQYGYYGYQTKPFGDLISKWPEEPSALFFPYADKLPYDPDVRDNLMKWIQTEADNIIFIYGADDTWTVCQADLGDNTHLKKYILEGKHHGSARISRCDDEQKNEILAEIRSRLGDKRP
ncbi:MAG: S28 family serine protease [Pirellulaceae bacterium]